MSLRKVPAMNRAPSGIAAAPSAPPRAGACTGARTAFASGSTSKMRGSRPAGLRARVGRGRRGGVGRRPAAQQALQQGRGFGQAARAGEAGRFDHPVRELHGHVRNFRCGAAPGPRCGGPARVSGCGRRARPSRRRWPAARRGRRSSRSPRAPVRARRRPRWWPGRGRGFREAVRSRAPPRDRPG